MRGRYIRIRNRKGFTLMELLIVIAIITAVLIAALCVLGLAIYVLCCFFAA